MLYTFARAKALWNNESYRFLICFSLPFIALISLQAFLGRAHANWATPTYIGGCILVTAYLLEQRLVKVWLIGIIINMLLTVTVYHWHDFAKAFDIKLTAKSDPFKRVQGWREVAKPVEQILHQYPSALLLGDTRDTLAELIYYVEPHPFNAVAWNPHELLRDHYDLVTTMNDKLGKDFIYVAEADDLTLIRQSFESVHLLKNIHVGIYEKYSLNYHVYYLKNFKGYPSGRS